jgi:hypothetical protein
LGLYDFGARAWDPELALWLSADPAEQFANPFAYGPNDPINGSDPSGMVWSIFRPSKYKSFAEDAGGLVYRKTGEAKEATDKWAKGDPKDDNVFHSMYRAVVGPCGSSECGDRDGDGIDDSYNSGMGISILVSDGGKGSVKIEDGQGRPIIPVTVYDQATVRKKEREKTQRAIDAVDDYQSKHSIDYAIAHGPLRPEPPD